MTDFTTIKPGDSVWLRQGCFEKTGLVTVDKITQTQIVARYRGIGTATYRFKRDGGWRIGGGFWSDHLSHVATETEVARWDAVQAAKQKAVAKADRQEQLLEAECERLTALFGQKYIYVRWWGGSDPAKGKNKFTVEIHRLSKSEVEKLADAIGRAQ